jgi:hypothetical protein
MARSLSAARSRSLWRRSLHTVRPNTAFTYRLSVGNFRAAVQAQVGGYAIGNASKGQYQGQIGADFGDLSLDGVLNWTRDAVSLSSYSGSPPSV